MSDHGPLAGDSAMDALVELIPGGSAVGPPFKRRRSQ